MSAILNELENEVGFISKKMSARVINFPSPKSKGGRPSKYSIELMDEICAAILNGDKGIERLCKEKKHWPSKRTIFNWLKKNKEFQRQYEVAKEIQIEYLSNELFEILDDKGIYIDSLGNHRINPMIIELMRRDADKLKWKIAHLMPRKRG